ncbi:MAG: hypothetical protein JKY65_04100 [Planctomycetes bacterium]|nr:hypothetical protein [Planctomycetota bacterium]
MISKRDVQLGKIALKEGFISKEQLTKCLALKKKLAKDKGKKVALGALLLKKGYLTKEQLQDCVKLHNAALEDAGEEGEKRRKKKRRSKRSKAVPAEDEAEDASEERPAVKRRRSKKRTSGGEEDVKDEGEGATATATRDAKAKTSTRSKRSRSRRTSRDGRSKRSRKQEDGDPLESAVDAVDPAVFASAIGGEDETKVRRLIACPDCGKKYRVRRNQVGRRFSCRRCDHRIKVPKDLFLRESEVSEVHPAMEVEEFVLGSGGGVVEEEERPARSKSKRGKPPAPIGKGKGKGRGRKKASLAEAAAQAAAAVDRVGKEPSIADLAAQAATYKAKPLAPTRKFTSKDLLTMVVTAAALFGMIFGSYQFFVVMPANAETEKELARLEAEFKKKFKEPLDKALAAAATAQQDKNPRALGNAREILAQAALMEGLLGEVKARATDYAAKQDVQTKIRQYMEEEGYLYLDQGGLQATRGLEVLGKALELPGVGDEVRLKVASIQIKHRQFKTATKILSKASGDKAKALLGLAWERGGVAAKAKKAYGSLSDPLGPVLAARADLAAGDPSSALRKIKLVTGLEGQDLAAMHLVKALALEQTKDFGGAGSAFDLAVANAKGSPIPRAARAEFNLRRGKLRDALADAKASNCARGLLAKGDAHLALLDLDAAMLAYKAASEKASDEHKAPDEERRLVGGYVDPLLAPSPDDPGTVAYCRLAQIYFAQERYLEAQETVQMALAQHPTEPVALATLALFALLQEQQGNSDLYLDRALDLCTKIKKDKDKPYIASPGTGYVLWIHGLRRLQQSRLDNAIEALELAPKFDPALRGPCGVLAGRAHERKGNVRKAVPRFLDSASAERNASLKLLKQFVAKGHPLPRIEKYCYALLARNPYHSQARVMRSRARMAAGKHKEALADANAAIEANSKVREAYLHRAFLLLRDLPQDMRKADQGAQDVNAAVALEGGGDRATLRYAQALAAWLGGDEKEARTQLTKCFDENEDFAWAYDLKAKMAEFLGKTAEAAAARKRFEELKDK